MKVFSKRAIALCLGLFLVLSLLTGCGAEKKDEEKTAAKEQSAASESAEKTTKEDASKEEQKPAEPVPIRWFRTGNEQDPAKDRILLELQKITNIKLEIVTVPWDQFPDKLNVMMATGEQLDLVNCDPGATLNGWAKDGIILPWDDFLKAGKYPLVNSVCSAEMYKDFKIDGKVYYKPLPLAPVVWGGVIRQDWLDHLGLGMPTTLDEFYNVMKAFKENDPDQDKKKDTYGLYDKMQFGYILRAYTLNAGNGKWTKLPDGTLTATAIADSNKEAYRFLHKMYMDGLIKRDFATAKTDDMENWNGFITGKYGFTTCTAPQTLLLDKMKGENPNVKLAFVPPLKGVNGVPENIGHNGGFWWGHVIPKTCKNPEKVLELLEFSLTEKGRELTEYGIEGIHFTKKEERENMRVYTVNKPECDKDWNTETNGYFYPLLWGGLNYYEYVYIPIKEYNYNFDEALKNARTWFADDVADGEFASWNTMLLKYSIPSPLQNVFDDRLVKDEKKLESITDAGILKCIVDKGDFDRNWEEMKTKWLEAGGADAIKAANEIYQKDAAK